VYSAPANAAAARIYCDLVKDALNEYAYDAEIAGLDYSVGASSIGLEVEVGGYNDKMAVLLEKVITMMRDLQIQPDRFKVAKDRNLRSYRNWIYQQPYHQVGQYSRYMNAQTMWLNEEYLVELENLTIEDVQNFFPKLLRQTHIEMLVHGNLHKEVRLEISLADDVTHNLCL
jgi:insulysin